MSVFDKNKHFIGSPVVCGQELKYISKPCIIHRLRNITRRHLTLLTLVYLQAQSESANVALSLWAHHGCCLSNTYEKSAGQSVTPLKTIFRITFWQLDIPSLALCTKYEFILK